MLTEIALTPQTFQPCPVNANGWVGYLRELATRLEHYGSLCPVVFSGLNDGHPTEGWVQYVKRLFSASRPDKNRVARDLLDRIQRDKLLVSRPSLNAIRAAEREEQWVQEAVRPAPQYPIDQVVCSYQGLNACREVYARVLAINALEGAEFWKILTPAAFPAMTIDEQMKVLRPIWLHGPVLAIVIPYALKPNNDGGLHPEASWFFRFAASAFARPAAYGVPKVELHVSYDGVNDADMKARKAAHPAVEQFIRVARAERGLRGHEFSLFVRSKSYGSRRFIARRLFAGEVATEDPARPVVRVRWGIALEHVAIPSDAAKQTPPTFALLPRQQADEQFRGECEDEGPRLAGPIPVRC
jgi:hypothetical protein